MPTVRRRCTSAGFCIGLDLYGHVRPARKRLFLASNGRPGKTMELVIRLKATEGVYPDRNMALVRLDGLLVDAATAHLVRQPERFDVLRATNLYGDILLDLASDLSVSLGLAGSIMASDTRCCAQAQRGSAPDLQGKEVANPVSIILSVAMLVQWMGDHHGISPLPFAECIAALINAPYGAELQHKPARVSAEARATAATA